MYLEVIDLIILYFELYFESICLCLSKQLINYQDIEFIESVWDELFEVDKFIVVEIKYDKEKYAKYEIF